jgi:hypothetical protein
MAKDDREFSAFAYQIENNGIISLQPAWQVWFAAHSQRTRTKKSLVFEALGALHLVRFLCRSQLNPEKISVLSE